MAAVSVNLDVDVDLDLDVGHFLYNWHIFDNIRMTQSTSRSKPRSMSTCERYTIYLRIFGFTPG